MKCPDSDRCQLQEHKGYDSCQRTGECHYQADVEREPLRVAREKTPYPAYCSMPYTCSQSGRCMRNPCCID